MRRWRGPADRSRAGLRRPEGIAADDRVKAFEASMLLPARRLQQRGASATAVDAGVAGACIGAAIGVDGAGVGAPVHRARVHHA